jgi:hypothetical protein
MVVPMTRQQLKDILERVMTWSQEDQERVARFVQQLEQGFSADDITDEEWKIIEERAARRDIAGDDEVKTVFDKYRGA